jgi:hypothetical protein
MRKATTTLLAAAMIFAMAGGRVAQAADRAGIGLEWAYNPTISLSGFDMDLSGQEFALAWKVSDTFTVAVFNGSGNYAIAHEYNDDVTVPATPFKRRVGVTGSTRSSGIRLTTSLPMLTFLAVGLEAGAVTVSAVNAPDFTNSDGTVSTAANFGAGAGTYPGAQYGMVGLTGKVTLLKGEVKTVGTEVAVGASLRFVPINADYRFTGSQETTTSKPVGSKTKIDPIESFNSLTLAATVALTF